MKMFGMFVFVGGLLTVTGAAAGPVVREAVGANAVAIQSARGPLSCRPRRGE